MKKIIIAFLAVMFAFLVACSYVPKVSVVYKTDNPSQSIEPVASPSASLQVANTSEVSPSPKTSSAPSQFAALITQKVQDYIQTKAFEGFSDISTFQDVIERYAAKGITPCEARVIYSVDLVGFPAIMKCIFNPTLDGLSFNIVYKPGLKDYEAKFNKFLTNISNALGDNYIKRDLGGNNGNGYEYDWQYSDYLISVGTKEDYYKRWGELAEINFSNTERDHIILPKNIPDIFYYHYGSDFNTVNEHETVNITKEYDGDGASLSYNVDNVIITYIFEINSSLKAEAFKKGEYEFRYNIPMSQDDGIDLMEETKNNLQVILGKPDTKEYEVSDDESYDTAKEMKNHECDDFSLDVSWEKEWLYMIYDKQGISVSLYL